MQDPSAVFLIWFLQVYHIFPLSLGPGCVLISAAVGVSDAGDDIVGLFEHPVVALGDGISKMYMSKGYAQMTHLDGVIACVV